MNTPATHRVSMLEAMLLIRAFEEALAARATPTSPGTCTSVGQEAAAVGVVRALERARPHPHQPPQRRPPDRARRRRAAA